MGTLRGSGQVLQVEPTVLALLLGAQTPTSRPSAAVASHPHPKFWLHSHHQSNVERVLPWQNLLLRHQHVCELTQLGFRPLETIPWPTGSGGCLEARCVVPVLDNVVSRG